MAKKNSSKPSNRRSKTSERNDDEAKKEKSNLSSLDSLPRSACKNSLQMQKDHENKEGDNKEQIKYKSRNIVSNWAKYDDETWNEKGPIPEKELENTGASFTDLISQSGTNTSTFTFKDESEWDLNADKEIVNFQTTSDANSVLSLDLHKIGKSLEKINTFKKLGLSYTLDSIGGDGFSWHGDYLETLKREEPKEIPLHKLTESKMASDYNASKWSFKGIEAYEKPVTCCLKQIAKLNNELTNSQRSVNTMQELSISEENPDSFVDEEVNTKTRSIKAKKDEERKVSENSFDNVGNCVKPLAGIADSDDELNFLLSISVPQKDEDTRLENTAKEADVISRAEFADCKNVENKKTRDKCTDKEALVEDDPKQLKTATDSLEDWLDTILD